MSWTYALCLTLGVKRLVAGVVVSQFGRMDDEKVPAAAPLLRWYDRRRRAMPWRALPGEAADPYRVWLSEIMLQQTTVATVIPYFERFLARFPTVEALAAAPSEAVMEAWAGLGYYARARNLHACARAVVAGSGFPSDVAGLRALPGIGAYTAAAVASIAFGRAVVPVDGNVERVMARVFAIAAPGPEGKRAVAAAAARVGADAEAARRAADFTQALFDLGATVCTPRAPRCEACPWRGDCRAFAEGAAERFPAKAARRARPVRFGACFWLTDAAGAALLRRRPAKGLLGGMLELPGTAWREAAWSDAEAVGAVPQGGNWRAAGMVSHGFTHFELVLKVFVSRAERIEAEGIVVAAAAVDGAALPAVMRRCAAVARNFAENVDLASGCSFRVNTDRA